MTTGAIIVAAGRGERLGIGVPKGLVEIDGIPLVLIAANAFQEAASVDKIVLVVPEGFEESILRLCQKFHLTKVIATTHGGIERQDSVFAGLTALPKECDRILIHDGARPFVTVALIDRVASSLGTHKASMAGLPVNDTLHINKSGIAVEGPDRSMLIAAQTPQGFHRQVLISAFEVGNSRGEKYTDEVTLLRKTLGINAAIVQGETQNIKITRPGDLEFYEHQLHITTQSLTSNIHE